MLRRGVLSAIISFSLATQAFLPTQVQAADPFAPPSAREATGRETVAIKGEQITQIFATVCQENNFAEFHHWALRTHLHMRQFSSPTFEVSPIEIKDSELLFSVKINDEQKWQAKLRDQKFTGEDPCEVANKYLSSRENKQISLLSLLIPEARAERLVNEATTTNWLIGALATASLTNGPFLENITSKFNLPVIHMLATSFRAMYLHEKQSMQTNLERILNHSYELLCSRNRVKIYGKDMHIVVKKGYTPDRLGFHDNITGKALKNEAQVLGPGKLTDAVIAISERCNHDGDAETIRRQLEGERELLNMKIAKITALKRMISSEK